jgi:hypothetical protein
MLRVAPGDGPRLLEAVCRLAGPFAVQLLVGSCQWLAGEPGGDAGVEVGALRDVVVGAAEPVADGFADGLRPGDLLVEFGELALHELPAVTGSAGAGGQEGLLLGEGEPRVAVEQDGGHEPGCRLGVAALAGDPGGRGEQAEFLVVAQGRGGDAGPAGQLADGEQAGGRVDFRCA